jgi:hypothetical protein
MAVVGVVGAVAVDVWRGHCEDGVPVWFVVCWRLR